MNEFTQLQLLHFQRRIVQPEEAVFMTPVLVFIHGSLVSRDTVQTSSGYTYFLLSCVCSTNLLSVLIHASYCVGYWTTEIKIPTLSMEKKTSGRWSNLLKVTRLLRDRAGLWFYFSAINFLLSSPDSYLKIPHIWMQTGIDARYSFSPEFCCRRQSAFFSHIPASLSLSLPSSNYSLSCSLLFPMPLSNKIFLIYLCNVQSSV